MLYTHATEYVSIIYVMHTCYRICLYNIYYTYMLQNTVYIMHIYYITCVIIYVVHTCYRKSARVICTYIYYSEYTTIIEQFKVFLMIFTWSRTQHTVCL